MSSNTVCGEIKKKSRLGISWNSRYLAIVDKHINIYQNELEYKKKNGKSKYSFDSSATITKQIENKKEVGVQISIDNKKKYKFLIPHSLWKSLHKYYTNIHNAENENGNVINGEQKTQDTQDTATTKQNITESNEILTNINDTDREQEEPEQEKKQEQKQEEQRTEEQEELQLQEAPLLEAPQLGETPLLDTAPLLEEALQLEEAQEIKQQQQKQEVLEEQEQEQEQEKNQEEEQVENQDQEPEQNQNQEQENQEQEPQVSNEEDQYQKEQPEEENILNENAIDILTYLLTCFDVAEQNKDEQNESETEEKENKQNESETEEKENKQDLKYELNKKYKSALDMIDDAARVDAVSSIVSEFCSICKMQCIDLIENSSLYELNNTLIRDEVEFKIIKNNNEYHKIKLLIANSKQYVNTFDGETEKLYCPLSCIVEYLNYKIYCKACLPMASENLVFGKNISDDTFQFNEKISKLLDKAAQKLNLSAHSCKYNKNIQISTTSNITVYETENDVYYVDNISELYPIDTVHFVKNGKNKESTTRLHPKFVELNSDSISSDAFIPPNDDQNDEIASKAIYNLHSNIIPKFAENINNLKIKILDCNELEQLMLERGINMIYIGEVYNLCKVNYAKEVIAVLMIAQMIKKEMNDQPITSKEQFEEKMKYFIKCFTNNDDSYKIESDFKRKVISLTNDQYRTCLTADKINNFSFKFVENEFERIFNASKQEEKYVFDAKIFLCVPDKYIQNYCHFDQNSDLELIQKDWLKLKDSKYTFEEFRKLCARESLIKRIDEIFAFHVIKFDIMNKMIEIYLNENEDNKDIDIDYCCSLFSNYFNLSILSLGSKHRQTLLIQIQLAKLLHSNGKYSECVNELEDLLSAIKSVFGKNCLNSVIVLKMLSDTYFDKGNYEKSMQYAKQSIVILDGKKRFKNEEYISAHLKISLIAEKIDDYPLGMRFLNKLYNYLKKQIEKENKQKLWENIDIKILCLLISRIKLKMCNKRKLNDLLAKWKSFYQDKQDGNNNCSMEEYNKHKELIIQNLCLNPIKKSNDLLKRNAQTTQVICWINIIKEFESLFLGIKSQ